MIKYKFSKWVNWKNRDFLNGVKYPGVYCIAISEVDLSEKDFEWVPEIKYIGMTNSRAGLKGRLKQFDNTILGKKGHGGAHRVRYKHPNYQVLVDKLFVSVCSFHCDVKSNISKDLITMGEVAKFEYDCFATYVENFDCLPEFNDPNAPKDV